MSEDDTVLVHCPFDPEAVLQIVIIAADQHSGIGKCPTCGRAFEVVTTEGPNATWTLEELKGDAA